MIEKSVVVDILEDIRQALNEDKTGTKAMKTVEIYRKNLEVATSTKLKELVKKKKELTSKYGEDDIRVARLNKKASNELEKIFNS